MSDFNELNVGPKWYIVHTYTGYENKVKATIEKAVEYIVLLFHNSYPFL